MVYVCVGGGGSRLQSNSKTQNHFPLQCKEIKDRLNVLHGSRGLCQPPIAVQSDGRGEEMMTDERKGEESWREERKEGRRGAMRWGRADGGVICVGCGRWGKHGCVSVLSDASRSVRNQFRAGRGRRAYNNWILLLTISFTCNHSALHRELYGEVNQAVEREIGVRAKILKRFKYCADNKLILQVIYSS